MTDALTDTRSGPTDPGAAASFVPPAMTVPLRSQRDMDREMLAAQLEAAARQVRTGELPFEAAVVVLHSFDHRSVDVLQLQPRPLPANSSEAHTLAALQRALTRWSLPLE